MHVKMLMFIHFFIKRDGKLQRKAEGTGRKVQQGRILVFVFSKGINTWCRFNKTSQSGRERKLDCKLFWYQKFYNHVLSFVRSKTLLRTLFVWVVNQIIVNALSLKIPAFLPEIAKKSVSYFCYRRSLTGKERQIE